MLATLRELKLDDNTLVLFSSDNGGWLARGEQGGTQHARSAAARAARYEGGMNVPYDRLAAGRGAGRGRRAAR